MTSSSGANGAEARRPKVLIAEKVSPDGIVLLQQTLTVDERKGLSPEQLLEIIPEYEALIVRSETKVTAALLAKAVNLKVVARAGVGVDNVDVEAATKQGIIVVNSPSGNIGAAAEHTIALLLATARNIPDGCASLKAGKWERSRLVGVEVSGKTLGIIGLGKVGLKVARMANGLGMAVIALDPYASPEVAATVSATLHPALPTLLAASDFLTIHTPLIASTKGMISTAELAQMKPTARILNVARGGTIDEVALLEAIESGTIAGAGIDVFTSEPPIENGASAKLIAHPKVVVTPHLGASTVEAQENVSIDVCTQVSAILAGELPRSAVNAPLILPEEYRKLQPFVKLVEKIGSLYTQHYSSTISGKHLAFDLVYEGELANIGNTKPLFAALVKGLTEAISDTKGRDVNIVNATLIAKERGIIINEQHSREAPAHNFSSQVTLRARPARSSSQDRSAIPVANATQPETSEYIISGYCIDTQPYISRLTRFTTSFVPEGTLLICHNYDSPGKIGAVGSLLGKEGVNIGFMSVAALEATAALLSPASVVETAIDGVAKRGKEALMILGVDRVIDSGVIERLKGEEGLLAVSVVTL
ncbi:MAG: hypothetical protein M1829_000538 [Trizodia sp. TS-e1964]|nr:MAG: hypothetical protein M1829_000538 [Trizodia sp. TS-e1964]